MKDPVRFHFTVDPAAVRVFVHRSTYDTSKKPHRWEEDVLNSKGKWEWGGTHYAMKDARGARDVEQAYQVHCGPRAAKNPEHLFLARFATWEEARAALLAHMDRELVEAEKRAGEARTRRNEAVSLPLEWKGKT